MVVNLRVFNVFIVEKEFILVIMIFYMWFWKKKKINLLLLLKLLFLKFLKCRDFKSMR